MQSEDLVGISFDGCFMQSATAKEATTTKWVITTKWAATTKQPPPKNKQATSTSQQLPDEQLHQMTNYHQVSQIIWKYLEKNIYWGKFCFLTFQFRS